LCRFYLLAKKNNPSLSWRSDGLILFICDPLDGTYDYIRLLDGATSSSHFLNYSYMNLIIHDCLTFLQEGWPSTSFK